MSSTTTPDRFATLPDEQALASTATALEEHGFSVEIISNLDAAREAVLARIPHGSSVMTNTSVTLAETGIADAINDGGPYESARNAMFALDFTTQAQKMKAIGGQPDYALGSVHAVTRDGTLVIASASAASSLPTPGARPTSSSWSARRSSSPPSRRRTSGSTSTAWYSKTSARSPPTGSTARSGRSSRSTRSCPVASTSSSSARWSGSDERSRQARGAGPRATPGWSWPGGPSRPVTRWPSPHPSAGWKRTRVLAGVAAAGSLLGLPRPGVSSRRAWLSACGVRPGPVRGLGFGAEECLDHGRQVSGPGDQVKVAAVVDAQLASRYQPVQRSAH